MSGPCVLHGGHSIRDVFPELTGIIFSNVPPQVLAVAERNTCNKVEGIFKTAERLEACMLFRARVIIQLLLRNFHVLKHFPCHEFADKWKFKLHFSLHVQKL